MRSVSITFRPRRTLTVPQPSQVWCIPQSLFIVQLINWANAAAAEETFRFESLVQFSTLWVVLATAARFKAPTQYISWPHDNINWDQFLIISWTTLEYHLEQVWGNFGEVMRDNFWTTSCLLSDWSNPTLEKLIFHFHHSPLDQQEFSWVIFIKTWQIDNPRLDVSLAGQADHYRVTHSLRFQKIKERVCSELNHFKIQKWWKRSFEEIFLGQEHYSPARGAQAHN